MSYLDRISACNNADLSGFIPFLVGGHQAGWVNRGFAPTLARFPEVFAVSQSAVVLPPFLSTPVKRTRAVGDVLRMLADEKVIRGWRDETYNVRPLRDGAPGKPLMQMERAAIPHFGVRAYGVHMNGFVRKRDGLHLWIGRRSKTKPTYPGELDNMVAGGQPAGLTVPQNLVKECKEEANIPRRLAERAIPVSIISYCFEEKGTLKPDIQYCYDLELPAGFTPRNTDGEIEKFMLWPIAKVARIVRDTARFKFNCNLVIIDFLVRHGLIGPEDPDYIAICQGLRR